LGGQFDGMSHDSLDDGLLPNELAAQKGRGEQPIHYRGFPLDKDGILQEKRGATEQSNQYPRYQKHLTYRALAKPLDSDL
jgi:hypothetical protein